VDQKPQIISAEVAAQIAEWIANRGGAAIWESIDLSDPGFSLMTPVRTAEGEPALKPHWEVANSPARIITNAADIVVSTDEEVKPFRVAIRPGSNGMSLKVSDGGSRRIRSALAKAGEGAYHQFDYITQEVLILKPSKLTPLTEWRQS